MYSALLFLSTASCSQGVWMFPSEKNPNFSYRPVEDNFLMSDPICSSAGCPHTLPLLPKEDQYPKDYFVPNFGMDFDIEDTLGSLAQAEKSLNNKWVFQFSKDG